MSDPEASRTSGSENPLGHASHLPWLETMVRIRLFEEKVQELFMAGLIQGTTHLCQGQEAVSVGSIAAMEPNDVLTNTYRGHGEALARGMAPAVAFAELMGRRLGSSSGVGGSMHLTDFAAGNYGANAIVGAAAPIAVGLAMSFKLRREARVAVTFMGDGAVNIGTFHESLNMAAVWQAPVIFIIVNNLYGEYSPLRSTTPVDDLATRAASYAMPGRIVDGQDIESVHESVAAALHHARAGNGPTLLEMKTYRYRGHSRSDPARYRPEGELERWRERDPIEILAKHLEERGVLGKGQLDTLRERVQAEIDSAAEVAKGSPPPSLEEVATFVYST